MNKCACIAIAGAMLLSGCDRGPPAPEKTVQQLMAEDVQPTAQTYWDAVRYESVLVDGEPVERDFVPRTDAEWRRTSSPNSWRPPAAAKAASSTSCSPDRLALVTDMAVGLRPFARASDLGLVEEAQDDER